MSTKIYNAYRMSKLKDIHKQLRILKETVMQYVAKEAHILKYFHVHSVKFAVRVSESTHNYDAQNALDALKANSKGDLDDHWLLKYLRLVSINQLRLGLDPIIETSIFCDRQYWYMKIFVNNGWHSRAIPEPLLYKLGFKDFHYQDQTDPPKEISYRDYKLRGEKWERLLSPEGNYTNGFSYYLCNPYEIHKLITKNYYKGFKDNQTLYQHLAYKFDPVDIGSLNIPPSKINNPLIETTYL